MLLLDVFVHLLDQVSTLAVHLKGLPHAYAWHA